MLGRIAKNAMRQVVAAGIFFVFTWLMARELGKAGYADFFLCWSAAQLVGAAASLGGYNLIVRGLTLGLPLAQLLRRVARLAGWQLLLVVAGSAAVALLGQGPFAASVLMASAVVVGAQASAFCLGLDAFELFSVGELAQALSQLALCWALSPWGLPGIALGVFLAAALKVALVAWGLRERLRARRSEPAPAGADASAETAHALKSYAHGLVQSACLRGMPGVVASAIGAGAFAEVAALWALLDKCLAIVQGANQMIYPRLLAGALSPAKGLAINLLLCAVFLGAALVIVAGWGGWLGSGGQAALAAVVQAAPLLLLFTPLAFWLLGSTSLLSRARYVALFACHALNVAAVALIAPIGAWWGGVSMGVFAWAGAAFFVTACVAAHDSLRPNPPRTP